MRKVPSGLAIAPVTRDESRLLRTAMEACPTGWFPSSETSPRTSPRAAGGCCWPGPPGACARANPGIRARSSAEIARFERRICKERQEVERQGVGEPPEASTQERGAGFHPTSRLRNIRHPPPPFRCTRPPRLAVRTSDSRIPPPGSASSPLRASPSSRNRIGPEGGPVSCAAAEPGSPGATTLPQPLPRESTAHDQPAAQIRRPAHSRRPARPGGSRSARATRGAARARRAC
jgi:hypothetical protein